MSNQAFSLFIAGDMLMSRPWAGWRDSSFQTLVREMQAADISVANLETVIHEFRGYAQAHSGGAYTAATPQVAPDLKRCGIDMVATANNHSFDYGSTGIVETLEHLSKAGIVFAGTGPDLQRAEAPAFFDAAGRTIALVAMTATFHDYNRASSSRADVHGRPGVNPLTLTKGLAISCPRTMFQAISAKPGARLRPHLDKVKWRGFHWTPGDRLGLETRRRAAASDAARILRSIDLARTSADLTIVSVHSHNERGWLRQWCHTAINRGADIVFVQGRHRVAGLEIYRGKPIFYGLGDFVFQPHLIDRIPAEACESLGLPFDTSLQQFRDHLDGKKRPVDRSAYEGAIATIKWSGDRPESIRLIPVDLQYGAEREVLGSPRRAGADIGHRIVRQITMASRRYGTSIRFDEKDMCGYVDL